MLKTFGLVVAGLLAGLAIAMLVPNGEPEGSAIEFPEPLPLQTGQESRLADVEAALRTETQERIALEARVLELAEELAAIQVNRAQQSAQRVTVERAGVPAALLSSNEMRNVERLSVEEQQARNVERELERLIQGGFTRPRAEFIRRRTEELQVATLEAHNEAQRSGQPTGAIPTPNRMLKKPVFEWAITYLIERLIHFFANDFSKLFVLADAVLRGAVARTPKWLERPSHGR